jgi:hypothetical protein
MSLFLSTCSLISSSMSVITGMKQINSKVATILQPHKGLKVSERDRRKLVSIHKRVESLVQPLNYCVISVKDRDSCIHGIVQYAFDLVQSVTEFLDKVKFVADESDPFTRILDAESNQKVDHFLRELEFACTSVALAVSIVSSNSSLSVKQHVSPSALLRASLRICEMNGRSGDLFALNGSLMKLEAHSQHWQVAASDCTIRLSQFKSIDPRDAPYLIRLSSNNPVLTLNFPIQTALSFKVGTSQSLKLPFEGVIDSSVITWSFSESTCTKRRLLHRNPSGEMDHDLSRLSLDSSDEETVVVHDAASLPASLKPRVLSTHISGPELAAQYAFSFKRDSSVSPVELVYMARLCVLESVRHSPATNPVLASAGETQLPSPRSSVRSGAIHLEATDEVLTALLVDGRLDIPTQNTERQIDETPRYEPSIDLVIETND